MNLGNFLAGKYCSDVFGARSMTALAARALRQVVRICFYRPMRVTAFGHLWECIVAKHAHKRDLPVNARMIAGFEAGRHCPALILRIPANRQHEHLAPIRLIQVTAGAVAGAHDPGHRNPDFINDRARAVALITAKQ